MNKMKELAIILIVLIVLIIFLSFILTLYYTNKNNSIVSQFSGGIIRNNNNSCGICSIINLYEGLIRPNYNHSQSVNDYDMGLGLPRDRWLSENELLSEHIIKLFTDENFNYIPNILLFERFDKTFNNIKAFNELIQSPICGMIIHIPGHYFALIVINYQIFIKLDGHQNFIRSKINMLYNDINIMADVIDDDSIRSVVLAVNKKIDTNFNPDDKSQKFHSFYRIKGIIEKYLNITNETEIEDIHILINKFINKILYIDTNIDNDMLHEIILHVRHFTFFGRYLLMPLTQTQEVL